MIGCPPPARAGRARRRRSPRRKRSLDPSPRLRRPAFLPTAGATVFGAAAVLFVDDANLLAQGRTRTAPAVNSVVPWSRPRSRPGQPADSFTRFVDAPSANPPERRRSKSSSATSVPLPVAVPCPLPQCRRKGGRRLWTAFGDPLARHAVRQTAADTVGATARTSERLPQGAGLGPTTWAPREAVGTCSFLALPEVEPGVHRIQGSAKRRR